MRISALAILAGTALLLAACSPPAPNPALEKEVPPVAAAPYVPVISLNEIMVSVVDSNSHKLWDAAAKAPTTDDQWKELEHSAVTLAAAGNLTAVSGNGPKDQRWTEQPDWRKHSEAVSTAGVDAIKAVRAKDVVALNKAGDALVMTCINCHREYKLDVPKIWSDHEQVH